jgi:hypothetical protein
MSSAKLDCNAALRLTRAPIMLARMELDERGERRCITLGESLDRASLAGFTTASAMAAYYAGMIKLFERVIPLHPPGSPQAI